VAVNIMLYGPPAAGKTSVGRALARRLGREFVDVDALVSARSGRSIPAIFGNGGEAAFRRLERDACADLARGGGRVIALGAGALLDAASRSRLGRTGAIVCLRAMPSDLMARLRGGTRRPLLSGSDPATQLDQLLKSRRAHYDSFPEQVDTSGRTVAAVVCDVAESIAIRTLPLHAPGLRHDVTLGYGLLDELPALLASRGLRNPFVLVTDDNVSRCLADRIPGDIPHIVVPAGEAQKTPGMSASLCERFAELGLDRTGTVIAVGGGVIGDLAGFASATFMRGVRWVNVPTTLLAMIDASVGGKTGVNLAAGKNLVGAFHAPALVAADPLALATLPAAERVSGMAEVVKHAVIGAPGLFDALEQARAYGSIRQIADTIGVKIRVVEADPFERGERATLNFGHTIGHAVEAVSGYALRHGEAVAIGLAAEGCLAERLGIAGDGDVARIAAVLDRFGLPTAYRGSTAAQLRAAMAVDKKKAGATLRFALPARIGEVRYGLEVADGLLMEVLEGVSNPPARRRPGSGDGAYRSVPE
jgi:shikimate kinase / 3-dehydroquinate synthase